MGRSYHVNCMGGAIDLPSQQFKEAAVAAIFDFGPSSWGQRSNVDRFNPIKSTLTRVCNLHSSSVDGIFHE